MPERQNKFRAHSAFLLVIACYGLLCANASADSPVNINDAVALENSARADAKLNNWQSAEEKLRKAVTLAPNSWTVHSDLQLVLRRTGTLEESMKEADIAIKLNPKEAVTLVNKACLYIDMGNLDEAIKTYTAVLQRFPQYHNAARVKSLLTALKEQDARWKRIAKSVDGKNDDYFQYVSFNGIQRWDAEKFPIKVFVPSDEEASKVPGYKPEYRTCLLKAFDDWQKTSVVTFAFVDNIDDASLKCSWASDPAVLRNPAECGEATVRWEIGKPIQTAKIVILTEDKNDPWSKIISPNLMHKICLHEIGHSLGIRDHSPFPNDIMFACDRRSEDQEVLSDRDIKTLAHLYSADVSTKTAITNPSTDAEYCSKGVDLAEEKKYPEALVQFQLALKCNPKSEVVKKNMAVCYLYLASDSISKGEYSEALKTIQKVKTFSPMLYAKSAEKMLDFIAKQSDRLKRPQEAAAAKLELAKLRAASAKK